MAAHRLDEFFDDRQAEAARALPARWLRPCHVQAIEDVGEIGSIDAGTIIVDGKHCPQTVLRRRHQDFGPRVFESVLEQVRCHLSESVMIRRHGEMTAANSLDPNIALVGVDLEAVARHSGERHEVQSFWAQ